jgi:hypothetical protein
VSDSLPGPPRAPADRAYRWFSDKWGERWLQSLRSIPRRSDPRSDCPPDPDLATGPLTPLGRTDLFGLVIVLAVVAWLVTTFFEDGRRLIGQDASVYYLPMWSYLGDRLAQGELPAWNPYQYGGSPFAADPESGWTYLPSMILYALFSIGTATTLWLVIHFLLASLGSYFYARAIALNIPGSVLAGVAYVSSTWFYRNSVSSPAYVQTGAWIPLAFLFIELAVRGQTMRRRLLLAGGASFAFGQIVAAWLGKGAYYSLLLLGGYLLYRTLIQPPGTNWSTRQRVTALATVGVGMGFWTSLFSAAGVLPRLEYHGVSNLAAGYQDHAADTGFVALADIPGRILGGAPDSPTTVIAFLAAVGLVLAGRRHVAPYFAVALAATVLLFVNEGYWLQFPFSLLPEFDTIHNHYPFQILMIAMFPFVILAGIAVSRISTWNQGMSRVFVALLAPFILLWIIGFNGALIDVIDRRAVFAICLVMTLFAVYRLPHSYRILLAACIIGLHLWPFAQRVDYIGLKLAGGVNYANMNEYYAPSGAVEFIRESQEKAGVPYRYFGYDPQYGVQVGGYNVLYRRHFPIAGVINLEVNNRATVHHLYDIQGQNNPIQIALYVDLFTTINEQELDYHEAAVLDTGLDSPYLDILNVRYIIVPAEIPPDRIDLTYLMTIYPVVYQDDRATVLERPSYYQHAFLVPSTIPVATNADALDLVASGKVDPAEIAPIVGNETALAASGSNPGRATLLTYEPERIAVRTSTETEQLLVVSDIVYPGWEVTIDGKPAEMQTAYGAFRSVQVPAGDHDVEFTFVSRSLQIGTIVSIAAYTIFVIFIGYESVSTLRRRRGISAPGQ